MSKVRSVSKITEADPLMTEVIQALLDSATSLAVKAGIGQPHIILMIAGNPPGQCSDAGGRLYYGSTAQRGDAATMLLEFLLKQEPEVGREALVRMQQLLMGTAEAHTEH